MIKNHKNTLFALIFIIILFFGYWYFVLSKKDASTTTSLTAQSVAASSQQAGQKSYDKEFVANLQTIQYINLDTSILQTKTYDALYFPRVPFPSDFSASLGRGNPFLPIGIDGPNGASAAIQVQIPPSDTVATTTEGSTVDIGTTTKPLPSPKKR